MYTREEYQKKSNTLRKLNVAAAILHFTSFVALLILAIIFSENSFQTELTTAFRVHGPGSGPPQAGPFSVELKSLGFYQIIWLELPFPLITALFHVIIALNPSVRKEYTFLALIKETNPLRWVEYAITASFMTWIILQLSGMTNVLALIMTGIVANIALQAHGYYMEKMNQPIKGKKRIVNWVPTLIGWIIFSAQWAIIMTYFFSAITSPRPPNVEQVPVFVYFAVIGLFFQFSLFGLVQLGHYLQWPRFLISGYATEIAFIVLSFVSKFFLDWTLSIGILTNQMS